MMGAAGYGPIHACQPSPLAALGRDIGGSREGASVGGWGRRPVVYEMACLREFLTRHA